MSAFKQFTTKDVVITPFNVNKTFKFTGNSITGSEVGIDFYTGIKPPINSVFVSASAQKTGFTSQEFTTGVYGSIKQLYYTNYLSQSWGDRVPTQSIIPGVTREDDRFKGPGYSPIYDNYLQSTVTQSRFFPTDVGSEISVISIPSKLYGENIVPTTFKFNYTSSAAANYTASITDNQAGNLISASTVVGQIFYSHGIAVFTSGGLANLASDITGSSPVQLTSASTEFQSSFRIYENQYKCTIRENEFGYSMNPSLISGSVSGSSIRQDTYYDYVTSSFFSPYITTVGLYNDQKDLLVVGKLAKPIPISRFVDTTIMVNYDL